MTASVSPVSGVPVNPTVLNGSGRSGSGGRGGRRRGGEQLMVPDAHFRSYYGKQILKSPTWRRLDIAGYLYAGGMAGGSAMMAALGEATGRSSLRRAGRLAATAGIYASLFGLVHDLGRSDRFLNMLRVFKPTSPMSMGTYILSPFAGMITVAAAGDLSGKLPRVTRAAGIGAATVGPALATYTAVLFADTAVPSWHEAYRELPFVFAGSAISAGGAMGAMFGSHQESAPARRMIMAGGATELAVTEVLERRLGVIGETYRQGRAGRLLRGAKAATAASVVAAALGSRIPALTRVAGLLATAGSMLTRFGIFETGLQSTADPRYVVVPQRQRMEREGRAQPR